MTPFKLNPRLSDDCHLLGEMDCSLLLLMDNALVPWFVLVPRVDAIEICDMEAPQQGMLLDEINAVSEFVRDYFEVDKLNVAAIGNVVEQLHVHVVGRRYDDYCWPNVVWGQTEKKPYEQSEAESIAAALTKAMPGRFSATA